MVLEAGSLLRSHMSSGPQQHGVLHARPKTTVRICDDHREHLHDCALRAPSQRQTMDPVAHRTAWASAHSWEVARGGGALAALRPPSPAAGSLPSSPLAGDARESVNCIRAQSRWRTLLGSAHDTARRVVAQRRPARVQWGCTEEFTIDEAGYLLGRRISAL
jgi:hypothetical protein